uniref:Uncharacterized protein n=1 Tax=Anguilla anguilla TaxID=7936 RepID=A0A0E9Q4E5_ANGAN
MHQTLSSKGEEMILSSLFLHHKVYYIQYKQFTGALDWDQMCRKHVETHFLLRLQ